MENILEFRRGYIDVLQVREPYISGNTIVPLGTEYIAGGLKTSEVKKKEILNLLELTSLKNINSWEILGQLNIKYEPFMQSVTYKDYLTDNKFFQFLPIFILSDDISKYRVEEFKDEIYSVSFDTDFGRTFFLEKFSKGATCFRSAGNISHALLGHGYVQWEAEVGVPTIEVLYATLSNKDKLAGWCWVRDKEISFRDDR